MLTILDGAQARMIESRASIGALQSRLDFAYTSQQVSIESLDGARSQMVDADMAIETAELLRTQILQQANISVLAQANVSLQIALQLLQI